MSFNPLKEKGVPIEKQLRSWHKIALKPFNKNDIDCYSRTRQILMNGIEIEAWGFKHSIARMSDNQDLKNFIANVRRIEDMQQTTINWQTPSDQSVLETTLGYEQVAVDLTAWLAQNEPDEHVKETFDFGLLEDFDHLYRYSQWLYLEHGISPNNILQEQTDVIIGRPTQHHHNDNKLRLRRPYVKETTLPQTKVNILTLVSAEQQTHNYYAEHGMYYGNQNIRETYAEIKDVEEEHVSMYESLIDNSESIYEKLLLHEFTEVCNYYNCYLDEKNERLKNLYEMFLDYELGHLKLAADLFSKYEKRDAEEIIGEKVILPCRFISQKDYVTEILHSQVQKRLDKNFDYTETTQLSADWASNAVQKAVNKEGSPTEDVIQIILTAKGRDLVIADNNLKKKEVELLAQGLQPDYIAPNTVTVEQLSCAIKNSEEIEHDCS